MGWTSPRTWVALEAVTASLLNTHLRDQLLELNGTTSAWATFTPTTVGFTAGVGPFARWKQRGKDVEIQVVAALATFTGTYVFQLPVAAVVAGSARPIGSWSYQDLSTGNTYTGVAILQASSGTNVVFAPAGPSTSSIDSATPMAAAVGDLLGFDLHYEAA
jgi:hypothetical protein